MSNLSELLPAGAGAKSADFVASGTLGSGVTVVLKSDGTVEAVAETSISPSSPIGSVTTYESQAGQYLGLKADPHNANRWMAVWTDDAGTKNVRVCVFTRSGATVTVSPISNAYSTGTNASRPVICFDPNTEGKFLVTFNNSSTYVSSIVGTFSGSAGSETFSYGTLLNQWDGSFRLADGENLFPTATAGDFILVAADGISSYLKGRILRISGTTVSAVGSTTVISSTGAASNNSVMNPNNADEGLGAILSSFVLYGVIFTISGTTISSGTTQVIDSGNSYFQGYGPTPGLAPVNGSQYILTVVSNTNQRLYAMLVTNTSGTLTNTTPVLVSSLVFGSIRYHSTSNSLTDPNTFITTFRDGSYNVTYTTANTISGSTITIGTNVSLGDTFKYYQSVAQQTDGAGTYLLIGGNASLYGTYVLGQTGGTSTNSADFIGITDQAIADTATGAVIVQGGVSSKLSGLTVGADYYVQDDGSISSPTGAYPYNLSGAVFIDSFSVSAQETLPMGVAFSADGTKMFIIGESGGDVSEYTLSVGFDVSTASFVDRFVVSGQDNAPLGLAFNADGTTMFIIGDSYNTVYQYTLSVGFDVSTASYASKSFNVSSQEANPTGIAFNTTGTKMFIVGINGDSVYEYSLSIGFDVSTASYVTSFSVAAQETSPQDVAFNTDGTKMFVVGKTGQDVNEYTLSTGFDVSTAVFVDSFSVSAQETAPNGIAFNTTGTKMFVVGQTGDDVNEYALNGSTSSVPAGRALSTTSILLEG